MTTVPHHAHEGNTSYVTIPLTKGYSAIVDPEDADLAQYRWYVNPDLYAIRETEHNGKRTTRGMHRFILERKLRRPIRLGMYADHINGDIRDNRRANLREATPAQSAVNRRQRDIPLASQYRGVQFNRKRGKWEATVGYEGKHYYLGIFATEELAALAYDQAAIELQGEFARTNFSIVQLPLQNGIRKPGQLLYWRNASGFRGVYLNGVRWSAKIRLDGKDRHLGGFDSKEEAARAYDRAAIAYYGSKAMTNFPHEDYGLEVGE